VHTDDNMDAVGAGKFPIAFGDFNRAYLVVDRAGIRVLRDPFTSKPNVLFYTTKRVGGGIVNFEAIKLLKISN
jgi:HK97 family phage major capsid protein